jgi:hypothetical protein
LRKSKRGRSRKPARRSDGTSATVCEPQEQQAGDDDDDVVEHRRPHRRGEPPAGVEDGTHDRAGAVEEHLRQEEPREQDRQLALGVRYLGVEVEVDDQRRGEHQQHGRRAEHEHDEREQPLRVRLAAVGVVLGRPHEQRDDDGGEDAAEQQLVDDVRRGVRDVVRQADAGDPDGGGDDGRAQEAGQPGGHRADGHRPHRPPEPAGACGFPVRGVRPAHASSSA